LIDRDGGDQIGGDGANDEGDDKEEKEAQEASRQVEEFAERLTEFIGVSGSHFFIEGSKFFQGRPP